MSEFGWVVRRWLARLALALIVLAALSTLYLLPVGRHSPSHIWPIHSHHFGLIFGMLIIWLVVAIAAVVVACVIIRWLWMEAR